MLSSGDISPGHCDLLRIFDNPNESQTADITQLLSKQALSGQPSAEAAGIGHALASKVISCKGAIN
jgi:hypothetical protein